MEQRIGFGSRLVMAFVAPWKLLFDASYAARVQHAEQAALPPAPEPRVSKAEPVVVEAEPERDLTPALQLLTLLQREGRFIDFLQEDVAGFSDADIGAAARVVHAGCKRTLAEYLDLAPIRSEAEGATIILQPGYDAGLVRVTGNVVGEPPFTGKLAHHGWKAAKIRLPERLSDRDPRVLAAAEVEL